MATLGIESNGRLEKTAIYYNGEQLGGIKEIYLNLDEDGTFDSIIQYEGQDKQLYTKQLFTEYLSNVKTVPPSFTEEEAQHLNLLVIESDGDIANTAVFFNDEELAGLINLFIHIKSSKNKSGINSLFNKKNISDAAEFKAEFTFRNEDDSISTEAIF